MIDKTKHPLARKFLVPGIYLILMNWWVVLFFLLSYSMEGGMGGYNVNSFYTFFLTFAITLVAAVAFQFASMRLIHWDDRIMGLKYLILCGVYAANVFLIFFIIDVLQRLGVRFGHFGGDPEGSWEMALIPSVIGYFLAGGAILMVYSLIEGVRRVARQIRERFQGN